MPVRNTTKKRKIPLGIVCEYGGYFGKVFGILVGIVYGIIYTYNSWNTKTITFNNSYTLTFEEKWYQTVIIVFLCYIIFYCLKHFMNVYRPIKIRKIVLIISGILMFISWFFIIFSIIKTVLHSQFWFIGLICGFVSLCLIITTASW